MDSNFGFASFCSASSERMGSVDQILTFASENFIRTSTTRAIEGEPTETPSC